VASSNRQGFHDFVAARTPELFGVAYALAGRQDLAERLLQAALECALLRWKRLDDPYAYTVWVMHRRQQPWWRRWAYRRGTVAGPAPERPGGRPVNLADLATAGAPRRLLARVAAVTGAVVVLAAIAVAAPTLLLSEPDQQPPAAEPRDPSGRSVVASYRAGGRYLLNPDTGEYEVSVGQAMDGDLSPDLRHSAAPGPQGLMLYSNTGQASRQLSLPGGQALAIEWSPDSTRLVATVPPPDPPFGDIAGHEAELEEWAANEGAGYRQVAVVEADTGRVTAVDLQFPDGRAGWFDYSRFTGVSWLDDEHLAVPTVEVGALVPDQVYSDKVGVDVSARLVRSVTIFDLTGAPVAELPIDTGDLDTADQPDVAQMWTPTGLIRDGRFLLVRQPEPGLIELAATDLAADAGPYQTIEVPLPGSEERHLNNYPTLPPIHWLQGDHVLVLPPGPPGETEPTILGVDLAAGELLGELTWQDVLGTDLPAIPPNATELVIVDADPLPRPSWHLAFPPPWSAG
jgi:hypothetical protein